MSDGLPHTILLDTHVWVWMQFADRRLGASALKAIESARMRGGVLVSAISIWEVALLVAKSRIDLYQDCSTWVRGALSAPGVILQPLSPDIAVESTRLPGDFHADPADRFLVATARTMNAVLVTADSRILAYSEKKYVRTLPA